MSLNSFADTVELTLKPSMRAFRWMFFLHVGLLLLVGFALPTAPLTFALLMVLALSWLGLRRHAVFGFGPRALVRMLWQADGQWQVSAEGEKLGAAELLPSSIVHPAVLVLNFRLRTGARKTRIVLGDELPAESLRRLRARLLTSKPG